MSVGRPDVDTESDPRRCEAAARISNYPKLGSLIPYLTYYRYTRAQLTTAPALYFVHLCSVLLFFPSKEFSIIGRI
jgi:hypothetical protein